MSVMGLLLQSLKLPTPGQEGQARGAGRVPAPGGGLPPAAGGRGQYGWQVGGHSSGTVGEWNNSKVLSMQCAGAGLGPQGVLIGL